MKCQSLFFWEYKKKYFKMLSAEMFTQSAQAYYYASALDDAGGI